MKFYNYALIFTFMVICGSCGTYFNQPVNFQDARIGESSDVTKVLIEMPPPEEKIVVGVYNFRDLTGQYKQASVGSTFSTAVTQGATSILIKALDDSDWFIPIERTNIGNLLNERNIIRSTRQQYQENADPNAPNVPPLLYAGIILEGGIVSYDSNILTGGFGARYFGVGGSTQYRQDRITIYLRAVSTSSGKILENIYVSKTILSQAVDASLFRYVNFKRLLEVETGFTRNEPVQLAVTEAIEKAVQGLIIEGIKDSLWTPKGGSAIAENLISDYEKEKDEARLTKLYDREFFASERKNSFGLNVGTALLTGDYAGHDFGAFLQLDYTRNFTPHLSLNLAASGFELRNKVGYEQLFVAGDLNARIKILPYDKLSPFIYAGGGVMMPVEEDSLTSYSEDYFFKLQYGVGLEYMLSDKWGLVGRVQHNFIFSDEIDHEVQGKRDDYYFDFSIGLNFYFGNTSAKKQVEETTNEGKELKK